MGVSFTLIRKEPLELTIEVDRAIQIEISTGFGSDDRGQVSAFIPLTLEDLRIAKDALNSIYEELILANKCDECGSILPQTSVECDLCDSTKLSKL